MSPTYARYVLVVLVDVYVLSFAARLRSTASPAALSLLCDYFLTRVRSASRSRR